MEANQVNEAAGGTPDRLMDGYDADGQDPPDEFIQKLMAGAPPELQERAAQFAKEKEQGSEKTT